jgi:hypothetical protein
LITRIIFGEEYRGGVSLMDFVVSPPVVAGRGDHEVVAEV